MAADVRRLCSLSLALMLGTMIRASDVGDRDRSHAFNVNLGDYKYSVSAKDGIQIRRTEIVGTKQTIRLNLDMTSRNLTCGSCLSDNNTHVERFGLPVLKCEDFCTYLGANPSCADGTNAEVVR